MIYSIVLIKYPFDDLIDYKIRPVVILSDPITKYKHLVTAFITSKIPQTIEKSDLIIPDDELILEEAGLIQKSAIRLHRLFTVPQEAVLRYLGSVPASFHDEIKNRIKIIFNITE